MYSSSYTTNHHDLAVSHSFECWRRHESSEHASQRARLTCFMMNLTDAGVEPMAAIESIPDVWLHTKIAPCININITVQSAPHTTTMPSMMARQRPLADLAVIEMVLVLSLDANTAHPDGAPSPIESHTRTPQSQPTYLLSLPIRYDSRTVYRASERVA